jgi:6-phosphogluconate dehydrogenase
MVHNGIEYGDMQLISEAYQMMKELLHLTAEEMHEVFKQWNKGELNSYLIEITRDILAFKDEDGTPLVDKILDTAGQKGTGKWTVMAALDLGVPLTLIGEAVFARTLSSMKGERVEASKAFPRIKAHFKSDTEKMIVDLEQALYASKLVSYAQGYLLMKAAAKEYNWNLNYGDIALMWRGGCIIRSAFLEKIKDAYHKDSGLSNLLLDTFFKAKIEQAQESWRRIISTAVLNGIWVPAITTALEYFDGFRNDKLPANLIQAQRDFFGAHMYERIDKPGGVFFHTNWTGKGGETASSAYNA